MKLYSCYVKSHCEYPDFESECEAKNKKEAVEKFAQQIRWEENDIAPFVEESK